MTYRSENSTGSVTATKGLGKTRDTREEREEREGQGQKCEHSLKAGYGGGGEGWKGRKESDFFRGEFGGVGKVSHDHIDTDVPIDPNFSFLSNQFSSLTFSPVLGSRSTFFFIPGNLIL